MSKNTMADLWKDLYENAADRSADFAGQLGGMAFIFQQLLETARAYDLNNNDNLKNVFEESEKVLRRYYTGSGSQSPFGERYRNSFEDFEDGIEAGMKEAV